MVTPDAGTSPATVDERLQRGREARRKSPRRGHGQFEAAADRPDPVEVLGRQAATRVRELLPIRYGRMTTSPFAFFRGAAAIMASDLAAVPHTGLSAQLCGDAHLSNFGIFASPERRLVFDINDFDETFPGPFEWDVKRLVASFAIAGRHRGMSAQDRSKLIEVVVRTYRESMRTFAEQTNLKVWYAHLPVEELADQLRSNDAKLAKRLAAGLEKVRAKDSLQVLSKLTTIENGRRRILAVPPLIVPAEDLPGSEPEAVQQLIADTLAGYSSTLPPERAHLLSQYHYVHAALKVVGVGSVGTRAFIVLLEGRDGSDPLFLQVKEAQASVLEGLAGEATHDHHGERVVNGQRLMQAVSDIFLGWHRIVGVDGVERHFYVRQLRDGKGSADIDNMPTRGMAGYGRMCGWTLARAHARSGDRVAIGAYLGTGSRFDRAMVEFAETYADQNQRDFERLQQAVESGEIEATTGI